MQNILINFVHTQLKKKDLLEMELESHVEYFYAISSTPRKGVQQKDLKLSHNKIFIQSTSLGSRCLKKGERVLYLKEVRTRAARGISAWLDYYCSLRYESFIIMIAISY